MKLTVTQSAIMESLRHSNTTDVEGSSHQAVKILSGMGLVTYARMTKPAYPSTPGGMVWHQHQSARLMFYRVHKTLAGQAYLNIH